MHNSIDKQHCNSHKTIIIIIIILTVVITITTVINFNRYLLKRLNTLFEKMLVLRFTTYYKIRQGVVTNYDSSDYYTSRQHVITIYDRYVITIHDTCYYISRQVLQYTTSVITIHDIITFHDSTNVTALTWNNVSYLGFSGTRCCVFMKSMVITEIYYMTYVCSRYNTLWLANTKALFSRNANGPITGLQKLNQAKSRIINYLLTSIV